MKLHIIRGHSGSGKSTLASQLSNHVFEADDYFMYDGVYRFDASKLQYAHAYCFEGVQSAMRAGFATIAVANTFTRLWEYQPYLDLAKRFGYDVDVHICKGEYNNVHNVPADVVQAQKNRFEL